jgi:hypothetical protein
MLYKCFFYYSPPLIVGFMPSTNSLVFEVFLTN